MLVLLILNQEVVGSTPTRAPHISDSDSLIVSYCQRCPFLSFPLFFPSFFPPFFLPSKRLLYSLLSLIVELSLEPTTREIVQWYVDTRYYLPLLFAPFSLLSTLLSALCSALSSTLLLTLLSTLRSPLSALCSALCSLLSALRSLLSALLLTLSSTLDC